MGYSKSGSLWAEDKLVSLLKTGSDTSLTIPCTSLTQRNSRRYALSNQRRVMLDRNADIFAGGFIVIESLENSLDLIVKLSTFSAPSIIKDLLSKGEGGIVEIVCDGENERRGRILKLGKERKLMERQAPHLFKEGFIEISKCRESFDVVVRLVC